jgi:hypothetical protein
MSLLCGSAYGQQPVFTYPNARNSVNASGTISVTNTFQSVFAAATTAPGSQVARIGCFLQNNGTHTMYVYFGPIASATIGASVVLQAGANVSCATSTGGVLADQVSITGTSGDAFFAAAQ